MALVQRQAVGAQKIKNREAPLAPLGLEGAHRALLAKQAKACAPRTKDPCWKSPRSQIMTVTNTLPCTYWLFCELQAGPFTN